MNGFIKKSVGTLTLGEKLKKLRSERRMSLGEASRQTRIQVKYLEYLEDGLYDKLPVDVYVRGFLRSYAEFLGVDDKILVKLYDKEQEIRKNIGRGKTSKVDKKEAIDVSAFVFTPKIIAVASVAILVFGGFFYLYREIGAFASTPRLVILSPDKNYTTNGNSVTVEGVTDRDVKLFLNGQPILVSDEGKFRESITVQDGTNVINIRAVNKFDKEALEMLTVQANRPAEAEGGEQATQETASASEASVGKGLDLEVRVDPGPVWVSVETDGNVVFSGTMLTGATQLFHADGKIVVNSGRGDATFVRFNGQDIGALADGQGAVRGVVFTPETKY